MKPLWLQIINKEVDITSNSENHNLTNVNSSILDQIVESPEVVNEDFKQVNVYNVNALFLAALLRNTFAWKSHMPEWTVIRDKVVEELKRQHLPYQVILRGLL